MTFKDYLESVHSKTNILFQDMKNYNVYEHAKLQAGTDLANFHRLLLRFPAYVHLLTNFVLIKLHLKTPLKPALEIVDEYMKSSTQPAPSSKATTVVPSNVIEMKKEVQPNA